MLRIKNFNSNNINPVLTFANLQFHILHVKIMINK